MALVVYASAGKFQSLIYSVFWDLTGSFQSDFHLRGGFHVVAPFVYRGLVCKRECVKDVRYGYDLLEKMQERRYVRS
jgi:hypothetical protein